MEDAETPFASTSNRCALVQALRVLGSIFGLEQRERSRGVTMSMASRRTGIIDLAGWRPSAEENEDTEVGSAIVVDHISERAGNLNKLSRIQTQHHTHQRE